MKNIFFLENLALCKATFEKKNANDDYYYSCSITRYNFVNNHDKISISLKEPTTKFLNQIKFDQHNMPLINISSVGEKPIYQPWSLLSIDLDSFINDYYKIIESVIRGTDSGFYTQSRQMLVKSIYNKKSFGIGPIPLPFKFESKKKETKTSRFKLQLFNQEYYATVETDYADHYFDKLDITQTLKYCQALTELRKLIND